MKSTIIAGTDFTKSSLNACKYAAMLADKINCDLILFNLQEMSWMHANTGLYLLSTHNERVTKFKKLKQLQKELQQLFPRIKINSFITEGSLKAEIIDFSKKYNTLLVVMGLASKNRFSKSLYGSHSVDIAGKIDAPVIIVPEGYKEHKIKNILLAVDNQEKLHHSSLKLVELFAKEANISTNLLHVRTKEEYFEPAQTVIKLNNKNLKIQIQEAKDILRGIKKYNKERDMDMIAVISKKHSPFYNLFAESVTHKISFDSNVPVMAIHA